MTIKGLRTSTTPYLEKSKLQTSKNLKIWRSTPLCWERSRTRKISIAIMMKLKQTSFRRRRKNTTSKGTFMQILRMLQLQLLIADTLSEWTPVLNALMIVFSMILLMMHNSLIRFMATTSSNSQRE